MNLIYLPNRLRTLTEDEIDQVAGSRWCNDESDPDAPRGSPGRPPCVGDDDPTPDPPADEDIVVVGPKPGEPHEPNDDDTHGDDHDDGSPDIVVIAPHDKFRMQGREWCPKASSGFDGAITDLLWFEYR